MELNPAILRAGMTWWREPLVLTLTVPVPPSSRYSLTALAEQLGLGQRLALAPLAKRKYWTPLARLVAAHDLHDLVGRGREGDAALGRGEPGVLGLLGDAPNAPGVAGPGRGQRALEPPQGEIFGGRAAAGQGAPCQMVDQTVAGQLVDQLVRAPPQCGRAEYA